MKLPYDLESEHDRRPALGLIVLSVDETLEDDFRKLVPPEAARLYHARIESDPDLTAGTIAEMSGRLTATAALLPAFAGLGAIGYACTSGATILGERRVADLIGRAHPGVPISNPLSALKAACGALGIRRLGLVSPYVPAVSSALRDNLETAGIEVPVLGSFDQRQERLVARIAPRSIARALTETGGRDDCDAVFAACTNLRAVDVLAETQNALGKPVLASNQVLAWHMCLLAAITGPGMNPPGEFPPDPGSHPER